MVLPSAETVVEPDGVEPAPELLPAPSAPTQQFWPIVSGVLALGWALTALLWWRSAHPAALRKKNQRAAKTQSLWGMNRRLLKSLRAACARDDASEAQRIVMEWAQLRFPDDPPNTLGAFAERLPDDAAEALEDLEECLYGRVPRQWNGAALNAALDGLESVANAARKKDSDALLPLYR